MEYKSKAILQIYKQNDANELIFNGCGFFISKESKFLTAGHVVKDFKTKVYYGWNYELMDQPLILSFDEDDVHYGIKDLNEGRRWMDSAIGKIDIDVQEFYNPSKKLVQKDEIITVQSIEKLNNFERFGEISFMPFMNQYKVFGNIIVTPKGNFKSGFSFIKDQNPYIEKGMSGSPVLDGIGEAVGIIIGGEGLINGPEGPKRHTNPLTNAFSLQEVIHLT